jgi:transposase
MAAVAESFPAALNGLQPFLGTAISGSGRATACPTAFIMRWFKLIRRRWVVERTFSWIRRNRRLMAHHEALAIIAEGFARLAMISVMLKRLTEPRPRNAA